MKTPIKKGDKGWCRVFNRWEACVVTGIAENGAYHVEGSAHGKFLATRKIVRIKPPRSVSLKALVS